MFSYLSTQSPAAFTLLRELVVWDPIATSGVRPTEAGFEQRFQGNFPISFYYRFMSSNPIDRMDATNFLSSGTLTGTFESSFSSNFCTAERTKERVSVRVWVGVCMCVCVCMSKRGRERDALCCKSHSSLEDKSNLMLAKVERQTSSNL